ncbi:MAG: hypothetical protein LBH60_05440 [Prevotellaceae bacterium]|jgi:hypothetical protein|nr:hypothetical protein [Prevotellaceae bacterium]
MTTIFDIARALEKKTREGKVKWRKSIIFDSFSVKLKKGSVYVSSCKNTCGSYAYAMSVYGRNSNAETEYHFELHPNYTVTHNQRAIIDLYKGARSSVDSSGKVLELLIDEIGNLDSAGNSESDEPLTFEP